MDYLSAICRDFPPHVRQEAILLLKRYVRAVGKSTTCDLQVVALTCANLAAKYWQKHGIPAQDLHKLCCNAFTRQDFIQCEVHVLNVLGCTVHWDGVLLAEWVGLLLFLCEDLLMDASDMKKMVGPAALFLDALAFQDDLMSQRLPSELVAAALHATVHLCTKSFQVYRFCQRVNHLCRVPDSDTANLSERILQATVGQQCADFLFEGGASDTDQDTTEAPANELPSDEDNEL